MIKEPEKESVTVNPNSREIAVLRGHFASCFNGDELFDFFTRMRSDVKEAISAEPL